MSKVKEIQGVLAENVERLRKNYAPDGMRTMNKFAKHCGIGNSALQALEAAAGDPQLGTLVKIAERLKLEPWHLFVRGIEPDKKPHLLTAQEMALHLKIEALYDEITQTKRSPADTGSFAPAVPPLTRNKREAKKFRKKRRL